MDTELFLIKGQHLIYKRVLVKVRAEEKRVIVGPQRSAIGRYEKKQRQPVLH